FPVGFGRATIYYYYHDCPFNSAKGSVNYTLSKKFGFNFFPAILFGLGVDSVPFFRYAVLVRWLRP
ncbi:MAG: hypothetical protein NXI26_07970, partial [bacterium]|nr:hypothetical protein [bacterium]